MAQTSVPTPRREQPDQDRPVEEPRRDEDKIAPSGPGAGRPVEAPVDPSRRPSKPPSDAPRKEEAVARAQANSHLLPPRDTPRG